MSLRSLIRSHTSIWPPELKYRKGVSLRLVAAWPAWSLAGHVSTAWVRSMLMRRGISLRPKHKYGIWRHCGPRSRTDRAQSEGVGGQAHQGGWDTNFASVSARHRKGAPKSAGRSLAGAVG